MLVGCGVEAGEEKKGNSENSDQSIACGVEGERCLAKARKWITKKMVVETLKDFAKCVGLAADKNVERGVEFDGEGKIKKIKWKERKLNGNLDMLGDVLVRMPRLQLLDLSVNFSLTGNVCVCVCVCVCGWVAWVGDYNCTGRVVLCGSRDGSANEDSSLWHVMRSAALASSFLTLSFSFFCLPTLR
jgi:hypothetical protein